MSGGMKEGKMDISEVKIINVSAELKKKAKRNVSRRKALTACVILLVVAIAFVVFFSVVLNARSLGVGIGSTDGAYKTVLANIEGISAANPKIVDIAMLGAHDANTASIQYGNPLDGEGENGILGKVYPVSKGFQYRYAVTQTVSVGQILLQGARFLHLKYSYYNGDWVACHSITGRALEQDVIEVLRFLEDAKGEVVVLLFQPGYFGDQSFDTFHDWLAGVTYNGKNLFDYIYYGEVNTYGLNRKYPYDEEKVNLYDLTYNDVTQNGTKSGVVLLDRNDGETDYNHFTEKSEYSDYFFDMDSNAEHEWHDSIGEQSLVNGINDFYCELSEDYFAEYKLRVNQAQAAFSVASAGDVFRSIGAWSLLKFAEEYNANLLDNELFDEWLKMMPIFQVDFVNSDYKDFNRRVNEKIRARNVEIVEELLAELAEGEI